MSAKFQLIVKGEKGKYTRGDCIAIDLEAQTIEEARDEAKLHFYGKPEQWTISWKKDWGGRPETRVHLNPNDDLDLEFDHGVLLDHQEECIHRAWIVQVVEPVDVGALAKEVEDWVEVQRAARDQDPKYQELLQLQAEMRAKYGEV